MMKRYPKLMTLFIIAALLFLSCSADVPSIEKADIKFNPGHYVAVNSSFEVSKINYLDEPAVTGVQKRYSWRTLEPKKGEYDFSSIDEDLQYLAAHDKQLVVFLIDRAYWIKGAMPDYLSEYELPVGDGFVSMRWDPAVVERLVALGRAVGETFDTRPHFEGVAVPESSLDLSEEELKKYGYTPKKYRDALITILTGLQDAMPRSHVFWYANFMPRDDGRRLRQVADRIEKYGVFMGGPDVLPYHRALNRYSYPMYEDYKDRLTLFCSAQDDSYRHHKNDLQNGVEEPIHKEGYISMEDIFLFARDTLHVRYLFWNHFYEGDGQERSYDDAIEVIRTYPVFNESIGQIAALQD